jgi:cell division protein FtsZ
MDRRKFSTQMGLASSYLSLDLPGASTQELESRSQDMAAGSRLDASGWNGRMPRISLVACGGAGIAMAREISKAEYGLHEIVAVDTDALALRGAANADRTLLISSGDRRRPLSHHDVRRLAAEQRDTIADAIGQPELVIVLTGLGGAAGTGISSVVGIVARNHGTPTRAFAVLPYCDEGESRCGAGDDGFLDLSRCCHNTLAFRLGLLPVTNAADAMAERRRLALAGLRCYLENTCGSVTRCGFVGNDFEDLQRVLDPDELSTQNSVSGIGWGEAVGPGRAAMAAKAALDHPLLVALNEGGIRGVSVAIRTHEDNLDLEELGAVMNEITRRLGNSDASIVFSADYDDTLADRIRVSVLVSRDSEVL